MTERVQKQKTTQDSKEAQVEEVKAKTDQAEELKSDLDDLLDEIDSVLEENAADFVAGYIQKGGQLAQTAWETIKAGFLAPIKVLFPLGWQ